MRGKKRKGMEGKEGQPLCRVVLSNSSEWVKERKRGSQYIYSELKWLLEAVSRKWGISLSLMNIYIKIMKNPRKKK